jgi:uncharacterized membrane protein YozB (DUF420 family)
VWRMALLYNSFTLIATTSLTIQIIVLFLLLYGYMLKRQLKFRRHGITMFAAVVLHLVMIFAIMIPSFVLGVVPSFIVPNISGMISVVSLIHVVVGASAVSLGVWLVASWRFRDLKSCFTKKKFMLWTMIIWLVSLFLGIVLYTIFYVFAV